MNTKQIVHLAKEFKAFLINKAPQTHCKFYIIVKDTS